MVYVLFCLRKEADGPEECTLKAFGGPRVAVSRTEGDGPNMET